MAKPATLKLQGPCGRFRFDIVPKVKIGLLHLQRKRPWPSCPNPATGRQWSEDMKTKINHILGSCPFDVYHADSIPVNDDASLRQALGQCVSEDVDVIVACQPVISDGRLAPVMAQVWQDCLVLWATPEEQSGQMISGNSLVGTHLMAATLRQLGFQLELVYGNLDWNLAEVQLLRGVRVAFAKRYLRQAKVGLVGYHAPGFQDFHADPFKMRKSFGTLLLHLSITEYLHLATSTIGDDDVVADQSKFKQLEWPFKATETGHGMTEADMTSSSRHYLAMRRLIQDHNLDGLAVRCWPELPNDPTLDSWCYLALARLATEGFPIACEGDVDGVLGSLIGKLLGCGVVYLSDWLEHDAHTFTLWHGGMAPAQLSEAVGSILGPCISRHFNNRKAGCLDATIKIGIDVTVYRFWVMDSKYKLVALEGRTVKPKRQLLGNHGVVELNKERVNLVADFADWVQKGFPHHVCVVAGRHCRALASIAQHCGVEIVAIVFVKVPHQSLD